MNPFLKCAILVVMLFTGSILMTGCSETSAKTESAPTETPATQPAAETPTAQPTAATQPAALKDITPKIFAMEKKARKKTAFQTTPAFGDDFNPGWKAAERGWRVATWKQNGTQMSPERCKVNDDGYLVQTVLAGSPYRGGSMQTKKDYGYGRWVARVKPSNIPGVLNSIFTIDWDNMATPQKDGDGTHFEIDIEFLTYTFGRKRGQVHLAVHDGNLGKYEKHPLQEDPKLGMNPSNKFHEWGFDIYPTHIAWHMDGKIFKIWKAPKDKPIPPIGHEFFMNSWTQPKWIKGPPKKDAHYLIDWVRFYPLKEAK